MKKILIAIFLCMFAYADNEINFDVVDSKGRSFWDKKFVRFDNNIDMEYFNRVCNNLDYYNDIQNDDSKYPIRVEVLETNRANNIFIVYTPNEMVDIVLKDVIMRGDKFILGLSPYNYISITFINDNKINFCEYGCNEYIMCPQ